MGLDIEALRASLQNKPFHAKEQSVLKMIQQVEAIQLQQQSLLATAKDIAEVFELKVGSYSVEVTLFDTVACIADQLSLQFGGSARSLSITKDDEVLPREATLVSLGISQETALGFQSSGSCIHVKMLMGKTIRVDGIDANTTIEEVKARIQHKEGIPADLQQVLCGGKQLEQGRTCGDYNIRGGAELQLVPNLRGGMCDSISGRQGFKVVANKIVFEDGNEWTIDGSPESLRRYSDHEKKLVSFASKAEMLGYLQSCRMEELLRRLELVQSRGQEIAKEAAFWMSKKAAQKTATADELPPATEPEDPHLDDALLERMLRRQEELRFAPETLERMRACTASGGEWLDVVRDLQREVAIESGFRSAVGIAAAVRHMQTAHTVAPKLAKLSVYARANLAEDGFLKPGMPLPDVALVGLDGQSKRLKDWCGDLTVVCAGSWT